MLGGWQNGVVDVDVEGTVVFCWVRSKQGGHGFFCVKQEVVCFCPVGDCSQVWLDL